MAHKVKHLENEKGKTVGAVQYIFGTLGSTKMAHSWRKRFISSLSGLIYLEKKEMGKKLDIILQTVVSYYCS